jgi:uncharacterized caspase-like protein
MPRLLKILLPLVLLAAACSAPASAAPSEKRLALVIGNSSYRAKTLATSVNDAALIAQTLRAAGFDVVGARDLDEDLLRQTFRDFVDSVAKAGPEAVAAIYFAGYGLQLEGENYLVPIDANFTDASEVPHQALALSEQIRALGELHLKASFIMLDAGRASPFVLSGQPPAGGLAWVEPEPNMLIAFNAAPGTVAPDNASGYGAYSKALAEMIRAGGITPADLFDRVRLRVNELTGGAYVPWDSSRIETPFVFFERGPGAPTRSDLLEHTAWMRSQPMRSLGPRDAYMAALVRDTFDAYTDFLADYWNDPLTKRVRALLAARREAIAWRRTLQANVPNAYWSYLERYPRGPHVAEARRILIRLGGSSVVPSSFGMMEYDVPPPLPDELEYVERTALAFDDPAFGFVPPPPPPRYFLEPPPPEFLALGSTADRPEAHVLPAPLFLPLPVYIGVPPYVLAPSPLSISSAGMIESPNSLMDGPRLPPSVAPKATAASRPSPPPPAVNSEAAKMPPSAQLPTVSSEPPAPTEQGVPADNKLSASLNVEPVAVGTVDEPPMISAPTVRALPPAAMAARTRRTTMLSPRETGSIPLPIPRPTTLAPPTGVSRQAPRAPMLSSQATGSIPPLVSPQPPTTRNGPKPIARAAATSSPSVVDKEGRPMALPHQGLAAAPRLGHPPSVRPAVLPPPDKKPSTARGSVTEQH